MTSQEESDEEYLDDPIQLIDFRRIPETDNHNQQIIYEPTDPEGDLYIEKNNVFEKTLPYKKASITLPVSFFEIPRNVQLLNDCKHLSIKVVNCEEHPSYYKQFLNSNYSDSDEEVGFYTNNMEIKKDTIMEEGKKIKIRPVSSPYKNLKVVKSMTKPKIKETETQQNLSAVAASNQQHKNIDFKRNQGLVGMKIIQTPDIALKITTEKKNKSMGHKTKKTKKSKAKVKEKKLNLCKINTAKNTEVASTLSTTNVTNIIDKVVQDGATGKGTFKEKEVANTSSTSNVTKIIDKVVQDDANGKGTVKEKEVANTSSTSSVTKIIDKVVQDDATGKGTFKEKAVENTSSTSNVTKIIDKVVQDDATGKGTFKEKAVANTSSTSNVTKIIDKVVQDDATGKGTFNEKEVASTSSTTNITKILDKVVQADITGKETFKEITIVKIDSQDKNIQVHKKNHSIKTPDIETESENQNIMANTPAIEPKVQKNDLKSSEKNKDVNISTSQDFMNDKKILNNTKARCSNKFITNNKGNTKEAKEKVHKNKQNSARNLSFQETREKMNRSNVQIIGTNNVYVSNSQKIKMVSNNANVSTNLNIVNSGRPNISNECKTMIKSNPALDQTAVLSERKEENKEGFNPVTTYSTKLQGLKLTVRKKDSANEINANFNILNVQNDTKEDQVKSTNAKMNVQKKNCDPVKNQKNKSSSTDQNKPVKNKNKKSNPDGELIKEKTDTKKKKVNSSSSNVEIEQPKSGDKVDLLPSKIMYNSNSDVINNKCNDIKKSNEADYNPSNSGVDKSGYLCKSLNAPVVGGKSQPSSFYINEYKKLMQSSSQQNPQNADAPQIVSQEINSAIFSQPANYPVNSGVKENTETPAVNPNIILKSLLTSDDLRSENSPGIPASINHGNNSNIAVKQNSSVNMKPNESVSSNKSTPVENLNNINQNEAYFANSQSNISTGACTSRFTHVIQNPPHQIPTAKRCPRIIKISKKHATVAENKISAACNSTTQNNINYQTSTYNYQINNRPIQTWVTTRDMAQQKPFDLQPNCSNSQMLSHMYSAAREIARFPFMPKQNMKQVPIAHQMKQQITSPSNQTVINLQAVDSQYKTEVLPPTCDVVLEKRTPGNDLKKINLQNMPPVTFQHQQQRKVPTNIFLQNDPRRDSQLRKDRLQIQPNMKTASCQNLRSLNMLLRENRIAASRQNINTVPGQETNQTYLPFKHGHAHHIFPYSQGFQPTFSEFSGISPQNFNHCAPFYNGLPSNIFNSHNQSQLMQNYWGTYDPSVPPPPLPPPPPPPPPENDSFHLPGQKVNETPVPYYQQHNNSSTPNSIAGKTIIGHDDSGPVRKININAELSRKESSNTTQKTSEQGNLITNASESIKSYKCDKETPNPTDTKKEVSGHSPVASSKKEMLEELTKITTIGSSNSSPVNDLKRTLPNTNAIPIKKYKPGPLSRKLKFDSMTSPQSESVASVTHKGYSPPILPIPTYQKTLEILARSNIIDPRLSHSISLDERENTSSNAVHSTDKMNNQRKFIEKVTNSCSLDENQDKAAKKISINDYKKRSSVTVENKLNSNNGDMHIGNIKMENPEQDLGYDSDSTTKP